jgi:geranylgeranyl pyrophosphate synthase
MTTTLSKTMPQVDVSRYLKEKMARVNEWLEKLLPSVTEVPAEIHQAMHYSTMAGGKRLRPILLLAAGEAFGTDESTLMPAACALEMIHTYSLIHDDLPAMDNDNLRRGMPTCHVKFGEAIAILAGDALLTHAFRTLTDFLQIEAETRVRVISEVAQAAGTTRALIGGQVLDIQHEGRQISGDQLAEIHRAKTGALIRCAVRVGAMIGGATKQQLQFFTEYGEKIGLAFQIADDVLDATATSEQLGKTAGKDAASHKATYVSIHGIETARQLAENTCQEAIKALQKAGVEAAILAELARFMIGRKS